MKKLLVFIVLLGLAFSLSAKTADKLETIEVSAEGLVDPQADTYKRDKGLMIDDLRKDALKQAIIKAVGTMVDSRTLVENYALVSDQVQVRAKGLIKRVIKETKPWLGDDGFMHMLVRAEVYLSSINDVMGELSRSERVQLIKEYDNPKISVLITIKDADRGSDIETQRSAVAENVLKEHLSRFGYRVSSIEAMDAIYDKMTNKMFSVGDIASAASLKRRDNSDFLIIGEAKFDKQIKEVRGYKITRHVLTSWTVKCIDNMVGEEIYFNNQIPRKSKWKSEDEALEKIGKLIGKEFNKAFFEEQLTKPSHIYQLYVSGMPSYDIGVQLKKELLGLRAILNVDFRDFDANGMSLYEIEASGGRESVASIINNVMVKPLNEKLGSEVFKLETVKGKRINVSFTPAGKKDMKLLFARNISSGLLGVSTDRLREVIKSETTARKIKKTAPGVYKQYQAASRVIKNDNVTLNKTDKAVDDF